jgi:hypothetical protein
MQGMSERQYASHVGLSRGAIQKAKTSGRLVLHADPSKQSRDGGEAKLKPVPDAALSAVGDTLRESGIAPSPAGGGTTFLQAKTANEVLKAQERRLRLQRMKGEVIDRARATALVFRLAREERDAWANWPARIAALMAAELGLEAHAMQKVLETHVRAHLADLAEVATDFR